MTNSQNGSANTKIIVSCADITMGDADPKVCDAYRRWLTGKLEDRYPGAIVDVTKTIMRHRIETNDVNDEGPRLDELREFVGWCWDECTLVFLVDK